jgi:RNA polymerase sigma factor (sigma-70 family)
MDRTRNRPPPWNWDEARVLCLRETRRLLRDRDEAEDAAQEAVVRAWRAARSATSVESRDAWLRTIAGNEARRRWSRRVRLERVSELVIERAASATGADGLEDRFASVVCEQMLAALPRRDRDLVRLRFVDDLSYPEIAAAARLPEGTVKTRIHRSLARLRTIVSNEAVG